jgi:hypothetical protein
MDAALVAARMAARFTPAARFFFARAILLFF